MIDLNARKQKFLWLQAWFAGVLLVTAGSAQAATSSASRQPAPPSASRQPAHPAAPQIPVPPAQFLDILVQNALLGLNQANMVDDYTVLLKNASTAFQTANTPTGLSASFKAFRDNHIDLAPVVLFTPQWIAAPAVNNGVLRLTGVLPSRPQATRFDLVFVPQDGRWRLAGLSVGLAAPVAQAAQTPGR